MTTHDDRIRRLLTESLDAELGSRLDVPDAPASLRDRAAAAPKRRIARWAVPAAAAAAVIGVVIGVVALVGGSGHPPPPAGSGAVVTCRAIGNGGAERDRTTLLTRARALGDGKPSVTVSGRSVTVEVPGAGRKAATSVCSSTTLEFRPVIAPAQVAGHGTTFRKPLAHLGFAAPTTEAGYDRLTAGQRFKLAQRLRHAACGPTRFGATAPAVACDGGETGARLAYLAGTTVLDGSAVTKATALGPGASGATALWSVDLTFDRQGAKAWSAFTGRHHADEGQATTSTALSCSTTGTACEDFVAFVVDGRVLTAPLTTAQLSSQTQISGTYTKKEARHLAHELGAGALPVPLHVVGTQPLH